MPTHASIRPLPGWRVAAATLALTACAGPDRAHMADPEPGVPLTLAVERAQTIRDLRYTLSFDIPVAATEPIAGRADIRFTFEAGGPLVLDFEPGAEHVTSLAVGGKPSRFRAANGHLIIPAGELVSGENAIAITFSAGDAALNRQSEFLYSLFVPARARLTFPCFDQPDLKARYALDLTVPADWQAVANGAEADRTTSGDRAHVRFAETPPVSTYLFAFAAGRFDVETSVRAGRTFRMYHRETDAAKVARNRDAVFDLHAEALAWLEGYTTIPYPFGKFDFVLIPSFQFSGMEHPGAIFYNAASILLDESATENQLLGRANVIAHETAHMWFGDLVTMRWFDDVWMKEVFANFMAAKIANPAFPTVDHELRFLVSHYPAAYAIDRTAGTHPIRQPLDNLNDAGSQYGAIIYQKAPIVMRQLERLLGADGLRDGLRIYLRQFRFGNATWLDLIRVLDDRTERDLAAWSRAWVEEAGRPIIETALETAADGTVSALSLAQRDPRADRRLEWTQTIEVLIGASDGPHRYPAEIRGERTVVAEAAGLRGVRFVLPNEGGLAYGDVRLDEASRGHLLGHVASLADPVSRGAAWLTLWEEVLNRRLSPSAFIDAALGALDREDVQQNAALIVGYVREAYWRYVSAAARTRLAPSIERAMRRGLARAKSASAKSIYFNGLRSMALTPDAVRFLERVWSRKEQVPALPLAEPDEATLALELAVRGVPGAEAILTTQLARFTNPDRRDRFAFVMPAVSSASGDRQAFFDRLSDVQNRRREPWVVEGLSYLHHPLRAAEAARFVRPSLDLLEEIQRTGDIFFPRNWLLAVLDGHRSPEVAATVRDFLDKRPGYPVRLRRIILQSADELFRAAEIVESGP
jgi:aminopeptidase N